jgi:hypothetical protein
MQHLDVVEQHGAGRGSFRFQSRGEYAISDPQLDSQSAQLGGMQSQGDGSAARFRGLKSACHAVDEPRVFNIGQGGRLGGASAGLHCQML